MKLKEVKIECENWWWNRQLQLYLMEHFDVKWSTQGKVPFNTRRRGEYLFLVQNPKWKTWWFCWGTEGDFERSPLPATTAKTLLKELRA